jgi:hypothetical protein
MVSQRIVSDFRQRFFVTIRDFMISELECSCEDPNSETRFRTQILLAMDFVIMYGYLLNQSFHSHCDRYDIQLQQLYHGELSRRPQFNLRRYRPEAKSSAS